MSLPVVSSAFDSDSTSSLYPAEAQALLRVGQRRNGPRPDAGAVA
jgi:hypothetical protein